MMNSSIECLDINFSAIYFLRYEDYAHENFLHELTDSELLRYSLINNPKRSKEFIATRKLRNHIFGKKDIRYTSIGAPFIEDEAFISISHSNEVIGIAVNEHFQIGLDLENITPKATRLHEKFLNPEEIARFDVTSDKEMTSCWSAKEALYKLANRDKIDFKRELLLTKESDNWKGTIVNPTHVISVDLSIFELNEQIVTINALQTELHEY